MCRAKHEGGRRCAAATRPDFLAAIAAIKAAGAGPGRLSKRVDGMEPIGYHASTPTGEREIKSLRDDATANGDRSMAAYLESCLRIGRGMRDAWNEVEAEVRARTT